MAVDRLAHRQTATSTTLLCTLMLASGGGFLVRQHYAARPLVPLGIFRIRRFRVAAMTSVSSFAAQGISFTALPFLLQETQQQGLLASGLLFAVWPLTIMIAGPLAGRLADRYHAPTLATTGLAVLMIGLGLVASAGSTSSWDMAWRMAICGLGFGFFQAPNGRELNTSVGHEWIGAASGIIATARTMGQALGAALAAVALGATQLGSPAATGSPVTAVWIGAAIAFVATLISGSRIRQQPAQA
jgi:DHA2 family multidrug resistance protein-like MFS transporter